MGHFYVVRECYPRLYKSLVEYLSQKSIACVIGSEGTGKSVFMHYFAFRYSLETKTTVLLEDTKSPHNQSHLFSNVGGKVVVRSGPAALFSISRNDVQTLFLLDGSAPRHKLPVRKGVGFFSPQTFVHNSEWKKRGGSKIL